MTSDARALNDEKALQHFGAIGHSFKLRHSSFVMFSLFRRRQTEEIVESFEHRIRHKSIEEQFHIERNDDDRCRPAKNFHYKSVRKFAHLRLLTSESHERPNREAKLHAEDDLACHQQLSGFSFAENANDEHGRNYGDQTRQQSSYPGRNAKVKKTFHHDLSGQRSGKGRILPGSEKCYGEEDAGETDS